MRWETSQTISEIRVRNDQQECQEKEIKEQWKTYKMTTSMDDLKRLEEQARSRVAENYEVYLQSINRLKTDGAIQPITKGFALKIVRESKDVNQTHRKIEQLISDIKCGAFNPKTGVMDTGLRYEPYTPDPKSDGEIERDTVYHDMIMVSTKANQIMRLITRGWLMFITQLHRT
jgi:hypothetical protein